MSLENRIELLKKKYAGGISCFQRESGKEIPRRVPAQLEELYTKYESAFFPFGMIYSAEHASEMSSRPPFAEESRFCFGQDDFFSFWLCRTDVQAGSPAFTVWDCEADPVIGEPCFLTLEELLDYAAEEYDSGGLDMRDVVIKGCDGEGLKELMQVRRLFSSEIPVSEIRQKASEGRCVIRRRINKFEAERILNRYAFRHIAVAPEESD